jgi:hypothetical protein
MVRYERTLQKLCAVQVVLLNMTIVVRYERTLQKLCAVQFALLNMKTDGAL